MFGKNRSGSEFCAARPMTDLAIRVEVRLECPLGLHGDTHSGPAPCTQAWLSPYLAPRGVWA